MNSPKNTSGFTLLELLVVLAMLAIMFAIAWGPANGYMAQARVKEGAEQFARDVQGEHFEAKRRNATRTVTVSSSGTTYTIAGTTYNLPSGVRFSSSSAGNITFYGPYGTTIATSGVAGPNLQSFTLISAQNSSFTRTVTVVGLIGKVIVK